MNALQLLGMRRQGALRAKADYLNDIFLQDLVKFAHLRDGETLGIGGEDRAVWMMLGRQQVVWRILNHLNLSEADLYEIYNRSR
jgi:hypothetical protein